MIPIAIFIISGILTLKMLTLKAWFLALVLCLPLLFVLLNKWIGSDRIKNHSDSQLVLCSLPMRSILATCLIFVGVLALMFSVSDISGEGRHLEALCIVTFFLGGLGLPFYYSKYPWIAKRVKVAQGILSVDRYKIPLNCIQSIKGLGRISTQPYHNWLLPNLVGLNVYEIHFNRHTPIGTSVVCIAPKEEKFGRKLEAILIMNNRLNSENQVQNN